MAESTREAATARRLFVGVMADAATTAALQGHLRAWRWPTGARLTPPAMQHLTLHFIGTVEAPREEALVERLGEVRFAPCVCRFERAEVWRGGVAVLTSSADPVLGRLHEDIGAVLDALGFALDSRAWKPHLTLARDAQDATPPAAAPALAMAVDRFALVWSRPSPNRGYEPLQSWPADAARRS